MACHSFGVLCPNSISAFSKLFRFRFSVIACSLEFIGLIPIWVQLFSIRTNLLPCHFNFQFERISFTALQWSSRVPSLLGLVLTFVILLLVYPLSD